MRIRRTSESLFLSAITNTGDDPMLYGVTEEMMHSYAPEYRWLASYPKLYGDKPSSAALTHKFPDFPYSTEACDSAFAAEEVINEYTRRLLVKSIQKAADHLEQGDTEEAMLAVSSFIPPARMKPMENDLADLDFLDQYQEKEDALVVPWDTLQDRTGGMRGGDLWYLAARLSQGKSWTLAAFARDALMAGRKVKFYSLEMPRYQVLVRMHVLLGAELGLDVDHIAMRDKLYDHSEYRKLVKKINEEVPGELHIHDTSMGRVTPSTVAQDRGIDLCIVDYAGLMSTPLGGRAIDDWRSMGVISNMLKEVALSNNMRIIAAAQINREGDTAGSVPPKVKNLAQSDSLGQDADVVITHKQMSKSVMVYGIEKNRHGASGERFYSRFLPNTGRFNEIDKDRAEDIRDEEEE